MPVDQEKLNQFVMKFVTDLGAQSSDSRLREVVQAGGFAKFRRATETPFNRVFEARL